MRERLPCFWASISKWRITPAYAGKTRAPLPRKETIEDHPRVCGKDMNDEPIENIRTGSPPRMRERHLIDP